MPHSESLQHMGISVGLFRGVAADKEAVAWLAYGSICIVQSRLS